MWTRELVVFQHPPRRILQIIKLPALRRMQKEPDEDPPEYQRQRNDQQIRVHAAPSSTRTIRSTRLAPQITNPLDTGINTAHTNGLTNPSAAAEMASTL